MDRIDKNELIGKAIIWLLDQGTDEQRKSLFDELKNFYCFDCGSTQGYSCNCWKDE